MTLGGARAAFAGWVANFLLRHRIESGISVMVCLTATVAAIWFALGEEAALLGGTGALCVSIVDQPGRLAGKQYVFLAATVAASLVALLAGLAQASPWALGAVIAAMSAGFGLATAYGRPAMTLGISTVLSLVLGLAAPAAGPRGVVLHSGLFALGGACYALLALAAARLLERHNQRMFVSEMLRCFAGLLNARAEAFRDGASPASLGALFVAHSVFMEHLQRARDAIFPTRETARGQRWIGVVLALLDAYEACLSGDADWEALAHEAGPLMLMRFAALSRAMAQDGEALALALVAPVSAPHGHDYTAAIQALDAALAALPAEAARRTRPTYEALVETGRRLGAVAAAIAASERPGALPDLELSAFVQVQDNRLARLLPHLSLRSPVMRYAIRLTLAMLTGYALTLALPGYVHGGWILLTIVLIMRASYALTRQRRNDRVLGTLAGCAVAAAIIPVLPLPGLIVGLILAAGVAHAFATLNYRITSFAASVMALFLLHLLDPHETLIANRIIDTLLGAGLAAGFSYLLPSWEWRDMPGLVVRTLDALRDFADQALRVHPADQQYRLARKRALDSFTALATTTGRLSDEPGVPPGELARFGEVQIAAYLFASDLVSVRGVLHQRRGMSAMEDAAALLDRTRAEVLGALSTAAPAPGRDSARPALTATGTPTALKDRLDHVGQSARRLAALAGHRG